MPGRSTASGPASAMVFQSFNLWSHMTVLENVIEAPVHVLRRPGPKPSPRRGAARQGRHRRQAQPLSGPPLGRPAAAGRDRPGARHAAAGHAVRRAHLGARPGAGGRSPDGDPRSRREGRTMLIVTHEIGFAREVSSGVGLPAPGPDRGSRARPRRSSATRARSACASSSRVNAEAF